MDHLKSHDGGRIQENFNRKGLVRRPHPPYSPDLSPYKFWFFEMAKENEGPRILHRLRYSLPFDGDPE
jgi:transposase